MHGFTFTGMTGAVRWGYRSAAALGPWKVTRTEHGLELTAQVTSVDAFAVSQRPLKFVAPHAKGAWTRPIDTLQIADGTLTARLGPREGVEG